MNTDIRVNPCPRKWWRPVAHSPTCPEPRPERSLRGSRRIRRPASDRRGIALIIALGLLALVTVMFLGYTVSMKSQRFQARNYNDAVQARMLAMSAVDRAMALIGNKAPVRGYDTATSTWNTWYSAPGMIYKNSNLNDYLYQSATTGLDGSGVGLISNSFPLVGGVPTVVQPTGLNQLLVSGGDYDIVPNIGAIYNAAKLDVYWINVGKDPSQPIAANTNPLAARYAFWVDDEAAKVNLNYAYLRSLIASTNLYSTHLVGLDALYASATPTYWSTTTNEVQNLAGALYGSGITQPPNTPLTSHPTYPFETLQEMQRSGIASGICGFNKFFTTVYGWDDNKTFAGALRRDITSLVTIPAGANDFEDSNISLGVPSLYKLMTNSTASPWSLIFPSGVDLVNKGNFAQKYGVSVTPPDFPALKQIIANIIDYQQSNNTAPSTHFISPTASTLDETVVWPAAGIKRYTPADGGWLGLRKTPYINEVLVDMKWTQDPPPTNPVTIYLTIRVRVELINPFNVALPASGYLLTAQLASQPVITFQFSPAWSTPPNFTSIAKQTVTVGAGEVPANSYKVYEIPFYTTTGKMPRFSMPQSAIATVQLDDVRLLASPSDISAADAATIRDYEPPPQLPFPVLALPQQSWNYAVPAQSFQRNDPRVRTYSGPAAGTPGVVNTGVVTGFNTAATGTKTVKNDTGGIGPTPPSGIDLQTDFMGSSFDPKDIGNPSATPPGDPDWIKAAPMQSIGELGRIHTGYQWRTLRLQPRPTTVAGESDSIPDWAILDLVRIPAIENVQDLTGNQNDPLKHQVKGRININQKVNASSTGSATGGAAPANFRERPLVALLKGWADPNKYDQPTPALGHLDYDIYNYLGTFGGAGFDSIGEICEVPSMQYGVGSGGSPGNDAQQEEIIRGIANLITTRSNVFTVWAVAQTVQDVNKNGTFEVGTDIITAEQKIMAVIERYEDIAGKVRFRIKYLKYLTE